MISRRRMVQETNSPYDQVIFVTAGYDHQIRFWQAHSGVCHRTLQHQDSQVNDLEISPDRKLLAVAAYQHIRIYDIPGNNPNSIINYEGISKNVSVVGFHSEGKWMYTGGEDNTVRIWDIRLRNLNCQRQYQTAAPVNTVCLHPNQTELFIGDQNGVLHVWDLKNDSKTQLQHEPDSSIQCLSINSDGTSLAAVNSKGNCYIWRLTKSNVDGQGSQLNFQAKISAHQKYALKCLYSPDSTLLATTSADGTAKLWRTSGNTQHLELGNKSQRWVWDCAFSDDSQYLLTASSDTYARLWNATTGEVIRDFGGHSKAVTCLAFRDCAVD